MTRARLLVAATALAALAATACGGTDPIDAGAVPPAAGACLEGATDCQDTGGDMGATPPGGGLPLAPDTPVTGPAADGGGDVETPQATEVEPTDGLEDVHPVGWDAIDVDPQDQTHVTVSWWSGVAPCNALAEVRATFTEDAVTLTVMEGSVASDEPQVCIEIAQYKQASVVLDEQIGPRSILDGADA